MVIDNLSSNSILAQQIIAMAAQRIEVQRPTSGAHQALRNALMTAPEQVPADTRLRTELFTSPYWGPAIR